MRFGFDLRFDPRLVGSVPQTLPQTLKVKPLLRGCDPASSVPPQRSERGGAEAARDRRSARVRVCVCACVCVSV